MKEGRWTEYLGKVTYPTKLVFMQLLLADQRLDFHFDLQLMSASRVFQTSSAFKAKSKPSEVWLA